MDKILKLLEELNCKSYILNLEFYDNTKVIFEKVRKDDNRITGFTE